MHKRLIKLISVNDSISIVELVLIMAITKRIVDWNLSWLKEQGYISREEVQRMDTEKFSKEHRGLSFSSMIIVCHDLTSKVLGTDKNE